VIRARPEVLDLQWPDPATTWYVRGHVSAEVAVAMVREVLEAEVEDGERDHVPALTCAGHGYARWGLGRDEDGRVIQRQLYDSDRGPGAFRVTRVRDADDLERARQSREAARAREAALRATLAAWLPEAYAIQVDGYPGGRVRFRLPGLVGCVTWGPVDPGHLIMDNRDLDAWITQYQGRPTAPGATP
jgi:hypothetical protein